MNIVWIEPAGRNSIPSSRSSPARPSNPFMRTNELVARWQCVHTIVPSCLLRVAKFT